MYLLDILHIRPYSALPTLHFSVKWYVSDFPRCKLQNNFIDIIGDYYNNGLASDTPAIGKGILRETLITNDEHTNIRVGIMISVMVVIAMHLVFREAAVSRVSSL